MEQEKLKSLPIALLGESILNQTITPVPLHEIASCKPLVEQMLFVLNSLEARIGLAAPQIFINKRIVIFRIPNNIHQRYQQDDTQAMPLTVMINPVWTPQDDEKNSNWEACISLPNLMGIVPRYSKIAYEYYDLEGNLNKRTASGFHARVVQHECDHLDGYVFTKRMIDLSSLSFEDIKLKHNLKSSA